MDARTLRHTAPPLSELRRLAARPLVSALRRYNIRQYGIYSSIDLVGSGLVRTALTLSPDIIHLHWLGSEAVSVNEIGGIGKPAVWTLHDLWPMCGALHYDQDDERAVWRRGVSSWAEILARPAQAVESWNWLRKQRQWRRLDLNFAAPSHWTADCAVRSKLLGAFPVHTIANALDTEVFRPHGRQQAREAFKLPHDRPILLFGAIGGLADRRKGGDLLLESLRQLPAPVAARRPLLCIFGQTQPVDIQDLPLELRTIPPINDDAVLATLYSACDVMIVPSEQESFPQTGTEAQACGCPVVTTDSSGTSDLVEHKGSGFLVHGRSPDQIAEGVAWVLADEGRRLELGRRARKRACSLWSYPVVSAAYTKLYERALRAGAGSIAEQLPQ